MSGSRSDKNDKNNDSAIPGYAKWLGFGLVGGGLMKVVSDYGNKTEQEKNDSSWFKKR